MSLPPFARPALLAVLTGSARLAYTALLPLKVVLNALPKAVVVPVLVVWYEPFPWIKHRTAGQAQRGTQAVRPPAMPAPGR